MKKILTFLMFTFFSIQAWADNSFEPLLNTVQLQFSAENWVTTKTALVTVGVNASLTAQGLENTQNSILAKLRKISDKGEWHIISYNRNLDQSGLERIQVSAQVRLASNDLSNLRDKAKNISVPGETYTIDNVEFTPSEEEFREANVGLRNNIYNQAKKELDSLNTLYPDQKFYVHSIIFNSSLANLPMAQNAMYLKTPAPVMRSNLSVGDKLQLNATVIIASAPNADVIKMVHN